MTHPQAFPHGDPTHGGDIGMTLRDWFAGQAMAALLTNANNPQITPDRFATAAYMAADALLAEREKSA